MGVKESVLRKARAYMDEKNYDFTLVNENKISQKTIEEEKLSIINFVDFKVGDKVELLDFNDFGIVHKPMDKLNNLEILYKDKFINVNVRRLKLKVKAKDLYPENYDLESLFVSFKKRKLEKDLQRGSKKALKKIQKEIKNNR